MDPNYNPSSLDQTYDFSDTSNILQDREKQTNFGEYVKEKLNKMNNTKKNNDLFQKAFRSRGINKQVFLSFFFL